MARKAAYDLDMEQVKTLPAAAPPARRHVLGGDPTLWLRFRQGGRRRRVRSGHVGLRGQGPRRRPSGPVVLRPPYARPIKASGAWMEQYRPQQKMDGPVAAIVSNNTNFVKPPPGQPVLVSWDDAVTLFHEFGPRPARHLLERGLPVAGWHQCRPGLRRTAVPAQRELAGDA
ncbi:MAG: M3 family metallopeptidase [Caulobacteraceae bacterium]